MDKESVLIKGFPLSGKTKLLIMGISFVLFMINNNLQIISQSLDYAHRSLVTIFLLSMFVLFSVGTLFTEGVVIGLCIFIIISVLYDFSVFDVSAWRVKILVATFMILIFSLSVGKISIVNLWRIIKNHIGV